LFVLVFLSVCHFVLGLICRRAQQSTFQTKMGNSQSDSAGCLSKTIRPREGRPHVTRLLSENSALVFKDTHESTDVRFIRPSKFVNDDLQWIWLTSPAAVPWSSVIEVVSTTYTPDNTWFMLINDGRLFSAGANYWGLLGQGLDSTNWPWPSSARPALVPLPGPVCKVVTGDSFVFAKLRGRRRSPSWFGWGKNCHNELALPMLAPSDPSHTREYIASRQKSFETSPVPTSLEGDVLDLWCGPCAVFAVMRRGDDKHPMLYGWGSAVAFGEAHGWRYAGGIFCVLDTPAWTSALARGLRIKRVSYTPCHAVCLLGSDDGSASLVFGWGHNKYNEIPAAANKSTAPVVIHDSVADPPFADGMPCVIVDVFAGYESTMLMTCRRDLLVRGVFRIRTQVHSETISLEKLTPMTARGGQACVEWGGDLAPSLRTMRVGAPGDISIAYLYASFCWAPGAVVATPATARHWRLPVELRTLLACWVGSKRQHWAHNCAALGSLPRDLIRLIAAWVASYPLCVLMDEL